MGSGSGMDMMRSLLSEAQDTPSQKLAFVQNDNPDDQKLAEQVQRDVAGSGGAVDKYRGAAKEDYRYYYGHQWPDLDRMRMEQLRRPALVFNEIGDKIDAISGIERLNRQDVRFVSRALDSDVMHDAAGDLATESVSTVLDQCDGEEEDSRSIKDMAIGGMGWIEIHTSYDRNLDGEVIVERRDPFEMKWDPKSTKENLADARWVARIRSFSLKDFKLKWPDKAEKIDQALVFYEEDQVGKYELVTPYYSLANEKANPEIGSSSVSRAEIPVVQYQHRKMVPVYRILDPKNPDQLQTITEDQWKALQAKNRLMGAPMPQAVRQLKAVYEEVMVAMGIVLEEPTTLPSDFSLRCITGQWDGEKKLWYGIVRNLKDAQNTMNKAVSSLVTQYITNAKGGVIFKTGTFVDVQQAKQQWAQPDSWIEAADTAELNTDILQRQPSQMSQTPTLLFTESRSSMARISGVSDEILGTATGDSTAPTIGKRVQGGLAILGWFWDNIARFRKAQARTVLEFVREYWSHGQLIRVGGNFNAQSIPLLKSALPLDYEMVMDDSVRHNPNLKAQIWEDLLKIAGPLMKVPAGQQILLKGLKFSPFPSQLVNEIQEAVSNAPPAPQKGRGMGKQEDPALTQAKVQKMGADTQKSLAEARAIDREADLGLAELVTTSIHKGAELRHKHTLAHQKMLQDRVAAAKMTLGQGQVEPQAQQPPAGPPVA